MQIVDVREDRVRRGSNEARASYPEVRGPQRDHDDETDNNSRKNEEDVDEHKMFLLLILTPHDIACATSVWRASSDVRGQLSATGLTSTFAP
jgi:hypothetical protein